MFNSWSLPLIPLLPSIAKYFLSFSYSRSRSISSHILLPSIPPQKNSATILRFFVSLFTNTLHILLLLSILPFFSSPLLLFFYSSLTSFLTFFSFLPTMFSSLLLFYSILPDSYGQHNGLLWFKAFRNTFCSGSKDSRTPSKDSPTGHHNHNHIHVPIPIPFVIFYSLKCCAPLVLFISFYSNVMLSLLFSFLLYLFWHLQ